MVIIMQGVRSTPYVGMRWHHKTNTNQFCPILLLKDTEHIQKGRNTSELYTLKNFFFFFTVAFWNMQLVVIMLGLFILRIDISQDNHISYEIISNLLTVNLRAYSLHKFFFYDSPHNHGAAT